MSRRAAESDTESMRATSRAERSWGTVAVAAPEVTLHPSPPPSSSRRRAPGLPCSTAGPIMTAWSPAVRARRSQQCALHSGARKVSCAHQCLGQHEDRLLTRRTQSAPRCGFEGHEQALGDAHRQHPRLALDHGR